MAERYYARDRVPGPTDERDALILELQAQVKKARRELTELREKLRWQDETRRAKTAEVASLERELTELRAADRSLQTKGMALSQVAGQLRAAREVVEAARGFDLDQWRVAEDIQERVGSMASCIEKLEDALAEADADRLVKQARIEWLQEAMAVLVLHIGHGDECLTCAIGRDTLDSHKEGD